MVLKIRRILTLGFIVLFLLLAVFSFFYVVNVAAVRISVTPYFGHVSDTVTVSGIVPPNNKWNLTFDTNGNGAFDTGEKLIEQTASSDSNIQYSFPIPPCTGSDSGTLHAVTIATAYQPPPPTPDSPPMFIFLLVSGATTNPAYDPPYTATANINVTTNRIVNIPSSIQMGTQIPINLTLTGGTTYTQYNFKANVTKPDGAIVTTTFPATTNALGSNNTSISFPTNFGSGQITNAGIYTITVQDTTFTTTLNYSAKVTAVQSPPPPHTPPNATITSISPNPAKMGTTVAFSGYGTALSGYSITRYRWMSNISGGEFGSTANFSINSLIEGVHRITFDVQDSNGSWSAPASQTLKIDPSTSNVTDSPNTPTPTPNNEPNPPSNNTSPSSVTPTPTAPPSSGDNNSGSSSSSSSATPDSNNNNSTKPTPTPTPPIPSNGGSNNDGANSNRQPTARLTITPPTQITQGQNIIITGEATDPDGTIANYTWLSDLNGIVSTSNRLNTEKLSPGTHHITFQATDNDGALSNAVEMVLMVNSPSGTDPLIYVGATGAGTLIAVSAGAAVWTHYGRPSSLQIKSKLDQKNAQQKEQDTKQEKKDEKKENKKRARLIFSDFSIPTNVMKDTSYVAEFKLKNVGNGKATGVTVETFTSSLFDFKNTSMPVGDLSPGQVTTINMPFLTSPEIRKTLYNLKFEVKSKQASTKIKRCYLRGGCIGLLTDAEDSKTSAPLKAWLTLNHYPFKELHDAASMMQLYHYDLLIVSISHDLPVKWVANLFTFVENGQSLLLLDRINTNNTTPLTEALGYEEEPNAVTYPETALEICKQHPITNGLRLGESLPLGLCVNNTSKFIQATVPATIVANSVNKENRFTEEGKIAAVMVKQDGKGKIVHLNFKAQEHLNQIDRIIKNSVDWLLWD